MTRKWGSSYAWVYRFLILRDGEVCHICGSKSDVKGRTNLIIEHKDNDEDNFDPHNLGLGHRSCNHAKNPRGPANAFPRQRERFQGTPANTLAGLGGSQSEKSSIQRARWLAWVNDLEKGPFALYQTIAVKSLANWAPRGLADRESGEESYGVAQTYLKYIEQDSEQFGGPLHIYEPKDGKLKGIMCVEYVGAIRKPTLDEKLPQAAQSQEQK